MAPVGGGRARGEWPPDWRVARGSLGMVVAALCAGGDGAIVLDVDRL